MNTTGGCNMNDWQVFIRTRDNLLSGWRWAVLGEAAPVVAGRAWWFDLKVARAQKVAGERNVWHLRASVTLARLGRTSEYTLLKKRDPQLYAALVHELPQLLQRVAHLTDG